MIKKANVEVRNALKNRRISQWQLADLLGVSEQTIYRKLRKELPDEEKEKILKVIQSR